MQDTPRIAERAPPALAAAVGNDIAGSGMAAARAEAENAALLEDLYRRSGRDLWAIFYAQCCDADLAMDAVQESFLRLHQRLREDGSAALRDARAWLARVGRNWLLDRRRRTRKEERQELPFLAGAAPDPASAAADRELHGQVRDALAALPEDDREALVLRYALKWPSDRIAEVLGTTPAAVDMRLSRARKRLAEGLGKAGVAHGH